MGNSSPTSSDSSSPKKELDASQNEKKSKKAGGGLVSYSYSSTPPTTNKEAQSISNNGKRSLDNSLSGRRGGSTNGKRCLDRSQSGLRESKGSKQSAPKNSEHSISPVLIGSNVTAVAAIGVVEKLDFSSLRIAAEPIV